MKVKVKTEKEVELIPYYALRGIKVSRSGVKSVIEEKELHRKPSEIEIPTFIVESGCDFAAISENYRIDIKDELPFS